MLCHFKKSIKNYNDELNYYTLIIIIYTLIISRPLFLGIILLILYIIALSKYECTILHHSKQSHGTVNVGKFMCICFGGYTIKIVCMPLFCMCTQYTLIWQNISQNYSTYKNDIFIPQIKHIMSFNIARGIITDNNTFLNLVSFINHRCYSVLLYPYFQLQFFFLLYTTVLLIIHIYRSLYLWKGNSQGRGGLLFCTPLGVPGIYRFRIIFRNMNDLPVTSIQDNNMFDIIKQNIQVTILPPT